MWINKEGTLLTQEKVPPCTTWDQQLHELSPHYLLAEGDQADAMQFPTSIPQHLNVRDSSYIRRQGHTHKIDCDTHTLISFFVSGAKTVSSVTPATMKSRTLCSLNVNSIYSSFFSSFETSKPVSSKTCV